jgi:hypothetical protein
LNSLIICSYVLLDNHHHKDFLKTYSFENRFRQSKRLYFQNSTINGFNIQYTLFDSGEEEKKIKEFLLNYHSASVLNFYTQSTFFHRVLNRILRQQRYDLIYHFQHVIFDLIEKLRQPLPSEEDSVFLTLYRGQQMTIFEIEKLKNSVGEIVYTRPFLSTTMERQIADVFAGDGFNDTSYLVSVILEIQVETGQPMRPYALINNSAEEEVLFSPRTKFLLDFCRKLHENGLLWHFKLIAIPEKQQDQIKQTYGETFSLSNEINGMANIGRGCSLQSRLMRPSSKVETGFDKLLLLTFSRFFLC